MSALLISPTKGQREVFVDSYQTAHYPATAIMPSVRDWKVPLHDFSELSDWFSFAIVSFQVFLGFGVPLPSNVSTQVTLSADSAIQIVERPQ